MSLKLIAITNCPESAQRYDSAGIDRIMIDLETNSKQERQPEGTSWISTHTREDIAPVKEVLKHSQLIVRVNPLYSNSSSEVDYAIGHGADVLMLPMFTEWKEALEFKKMVNGRAKVCLLVETPAALARLESIIKCVMPDEIHIGLNDLHRGMGLNFMFEPLAFGLMDFVSNIMSRTEILWGFGGIAKIGSGLVPAERILAEHIRLKSQMVILSREFFIGNASDIFDDVHKLRDLEIVTASLSSEILLQQHEELQAIIKSICDTAK